VNPEVSKRVEVKSEGKWWKARVIDARAGTFHVHYYGFEDSDDEWVRLSQMRETKTEYPGAERIRRVNNTNRPPSDAWRTDKIQPWVP
jgi:hypothetical protein